MLDSLQYPFIQNALLAGTFAAIVAAVVGYFLIIRGLTFAAHALPNIGFAGAAGAVFLNVNPAFGLFAFTIAAGVGIGLLGKEVRERDIAIGILMTFSLGLGLMFLALYSGYAARVYSILFGTILGISQADVLLAALACVFIIAIVLLFFRQLLFSSFDPEVAQARGVPVRWLAVLFLMLVAVVVSIAVQIIGALLIFTLLIGPAATAMRITTRPGRAIALAVVLGVGYTWLGILLSAGYGFWPVSFYIATISFAIYLPVRLLSPLWSGHGVRRYPASLPTNNALPAIGEPDPFAETARHA